MRSRRQRSIPLGGRYRQVSLYKWNRVPSIMTNCCDWARMLLAFRPLLGKSPVSKYLMIDPKSSESFWAFCKSVLAATRGRVSWTYAQASSTAFTGKVSCSETSGADVVTGLSLYSNIAWTHYLGCAVRTGMLSWGSVVETSCSGRYDLRDCASATLLYLICQAYGALWKKILVGRETIEPNDHQITL